MATKVTLPYFAPAETLPGPLPTVEDIMASEIRLSPHGPVVYRVFGHYAVKYGVSISLQEGENMLFVQQSTNIPIPKVYALFSAEWQGRKGNFIVMKYIPGETLHDAWGRFSVTEKQATILRLRGYFDELRSIPSPGYYGGVWRQPIRDYWFLRDGYEAPEPHEEPEIAGPHGTEEQWNEAMCRVISKVLPFLTPLQMDFYRRHFRSVLKGHPPVFTHGNFVPQNIMLRPDGSLVIIDWEYSGWYPSYWEYGATIAVLRHLPFIEWVYGMLDEYAAELGWLSAFQDIARR